MFGLRKLASVVVGQIARKCRSSSGLRPRARCLFDASELYPPPVYRARLNYADVMDVAFSDGGRAGCEDFHAHVLTLMKDLKTFNAKHLADGTAESPLSHWTTDAIRGGPDVCAPINQKKAAAAAAEPKTATLKTGLVFKPGDSPPVVEKGFIEIPSRPSRFKNVVNPIVVVEKPDEKK